MQTILIVEDDAALRQALVDAFTRESYTVHAAVNGQLGLEQALKVHPDMILLDLIMPVMDGMSMLKSLRADAWGKDAQVIILTNFSDTASVATAVEQHTFNFLDKSDWSIAALVKKVKDQLAGTKGKAQ